MVDDFSRRAVERKTLGRLDALFKRRECTMFGFWKEIEWVNATTFIGSLGLFTVEVRTRLLFAWYLPSRISVAIRLLPVFAILSRIPQSLANLGLSDLKTPSFRYESDRSFLQLHWSKKWYRGMHITKKKLSKNAHRKGFLIFPDIFESELIRCCRAANGISQYLRKIQIYLENSFHMRKSLNFCNTGAKI